MAKQQQLSALCLVVALLACSSGSVLAQRRRQEPAQPVPDLLETSSLPTAVKSNWRQVARFMWNWLLTHDHDYYDAAGNVVSSMSATVASAKSGPTVKCGRFARNWVSCRLGRVAAVVYTSLHAGWLADGWQDPSAGSIMSLPAAAAAAALMSQQLCCKHTQPPHHHTAALTPCKPWNNLSFAFADPSGLPRLRHLLSVPAQGESTGNCHYSEGCGTRQW